jgi:adenine/guanine phosphoribosyltransferase-like PRPP-binding protein
MAETHLHDLKFRLMAVELLRMAKKQYTYRKLASHTNLPVTVLSRYVKGHVLPSTKRARKIWKDLENIVNLAQELERRIKFDELGYFDNTSIVGDVALLSQAAQSALSKFAGKRITKVLTAAVDGIPLATEVASALGVDLVIAKKTKEVGVQEFVEETLIPGDSAVVMSLYVKRGLIKRGDSVLIVDDIIRTGETERALVNLILKSKADVAGMYALVAIGDKWRQVIEPLTGVLTEVVFSVKSPSAV